MIFVGFFSKIFKKNDRKKEEAPKLNIDTKEQTNEPSVKTPTKAASPAKKSTAGKKKSEPTKQKTQPTGKKPKSTATTPKDVKAAEKPGQIKNVNNGFFEIKKSKDDRYVFNLFAANKMIVATSQVYTSPQSALNGINSVIANAESANIEDQTVKEFIPQSYPKWEIYKDKAGDFRFRLSASNGSCICHSQGYTSKANCKKGIESIIKNTKTAKVEKTYLKKQ